MTSPRSNSPKEAYDASDPKAERLARQKKELRDEGIRNWLVASMENPAARNWFWDLLCSGHAFQTSFVNGDAMTTVFKEGERNVILGVMAQLSADTPQALIQIMGEQGNA